MPMGKGTYGKKKGRPSKKTNPKKRVSKKSPKKMKKSSMY
tara:strand:- start:10143 stop:10262 length:120 start_codon:yes stop_codon:yes gene_type:complete